MPDNMNSDRAFLDIRQASKSFGAAKVLHGVDLAVAKGEFVSLLGPSGCGKTTLLRIVAGLLAADQGHVMLDGADISAKPPHHRDVGVVFQDPDDQLFMPTVAEDVAFGPYNMGLRGEELEHVVEDALEAVGMLHFRDRPPHHLSFGQRRRVAVATVLAMKPRIVVLDEPSSNLDPASRRELADILRSLDITMLMVTHDLPYAYELCERSLVLSGGVIVADGATPEILRDEALLARHRLELPVGYRLT
jgi:cobalt/nickel transport system ATP-binding protein